MRQAIGASLLATKGPAVAEVEQTFLRAQYLCAHLDNPHQLFPIRRGLWVYHLNRAEYQTAHALGEQLLTLAQQVREASMLCAAHRTLGTTSFALGVIATAHTHFRQGIQLSDAQQHRTSTFLYGEDAGVICRSQGAWALWCLGYPHQGLAWSDEAVTLAQQIAHPYSLGFALALAAVFHTLRREWHCTQERAEAAISLAKEQEFPFWVAVSSLLRGWALVHQGQAQEGIEQMSQGLTAWRATGVVVFRPYWQALIADVHGTLGAPEAGLTALAEALTLTETTGERWYESEIYRLKGALLVQQHVANQTEAEHCFQQAISIARSQQAKSLELRVAISLARLWQQ